MSLDTLPRHLALTQELVDKEFEHIARYALSEPTMELPFTPRSNATPPPRHLASDTSPIPPDPEDRVSEHHGPGRHRAPRPNLIEWVGSRATRITAVSMLGASLALTSAGSLLEDSLEKQTIYTTLNEPAVAFPDITEPIDRPASLAKPSAKPTPTPTKLVTTPKLTPPKVPTPPKKPVPATTAKKPTIAAADHWPAPGTNCNYLPKHQHKASETSRAQTKAIFKKMVIACFGAKEWPAANDLWTRESDFNPVAVNPDGGACLVVQAKPCRKALRAIGANSVGNTTVEKQARWGNGYIKERYGTPTKALRHWLARVPINGRDVGHWY